MSDPCNDLIECKCCGNTVGAMAAACPKCGTPNGWVHPAVQRMLDKAGTIETSRQFTFNHDKAIVWGETGTFHTLTSGMTLAVSILLCLVLALFAFWFASIVGGVGMFIAMTARRKETFRADLSAGTWTSTNDEFWRPVLDILGTDVSRASASGA